MTPEQLAARWLAGVPRFKLHGGNLLPEADAIAAIAQRLAPGDDLVERATAALEGVTPGNWEAVFDRQTWGWLEVDGPSFKIGAPTRATDLTLADEAQRKRDARFIAFTRQWVPEAAARLSALTAELDAAYKAVDENWVTHQRVVAAETEAANMRAILATIVSRCDTAKQQCNDGEPVSAFNLASAILGQIGSYRATLQPSEKPE